MNSISASITQYFTTLVGGTKEGYYKVGQVFEVAVLVLTGGSGATIKATANVAKSVSAKVVNKIDDIGSFFSNVAQATSRGGVAAKKWFRCRILGNGCFVKDTPVLMARNANQYSLLNPAKAVAFAAAMPIVAVPIQEVNLLDYAVAHKTVNQQNNLIASTNEDIYSGLFGGDPYTSQQQKQKDKYEINDTNWNEVVFEEVHGSSIAKLALHRDWINQNNYAVHGIVNMNLPEQGISGPFKITSIKHILPQKKPVDEDPNDKYEYRPVTGLFIHHSDQVHNITFDNNETIGVTALHPIFSTTHNDWRLAGELEAGEKVLTYHGEATVTKTEKKSGSEAVYNLEVKDLHNFLVGDGGVVVHNACAKSILGDVEFKARKDFYKSLGHSAAEAEELVELDALKTGLIDQAIKSGNYVEKGLADVIRRAAKEFANDMLEVLKSEIGNLAANAASEVTLDILLNDGSPMFTIYADQLANTTTGDLHVGEAKYSTLDKDWDKDWKSAATENQKKFVSALNSGSITSITPRGTKDKLGPLGLIHGQSFSPAKIKSYRLFGSNAGTKTIKKILRLF